MQAKSFIVTSSNEMQENFKHNISYFEDNLRLGDRVVLLRAPHTLYDDHYASFCRNLKNSR